MYVDHRISAHPTTLRARALAWWGLVLLSCGPSLLLAGNGAGPAFGTGRVATVDTVLVSTVRGHLRAPRCTDAGDDAHDPPPAPGVAPATACTGASPAPVPPAGVRTHLPAPPDFLHPPLRAPPLT